MVSGSQEDMRKTFSACLTPQSTLHVPSPTNPSTRRIGTPGHPTRLQTSAVMPERHLPACVDSGLAARALLACCNNTHRFQSRFCQSQSSLSDVGAEKLWMPQKVRSVCCAYVRNSQRHPATATARWYPSVLTTYHSQERRPSKTSLLRKSTRLDIP